MNLPSIFAPLPKPLAISRASLSMTTPLVQTVISVTLAIRPSFFLDDGALLDLLTRSHENLVMAHDSGVRLRIPVQRVAPFLSCPCVSVRGQENNAGEKVCWCGSANSIGERY